MSEIFEQETLQYKNRMLMCYVEMNGMIAENEYARYHDKEPRYRFADFITLFKKYGISPNAVPTYKGE